MDEPSGGTLRFTGHWILTNVFVTQADILTSVLSIRCLHSNFTLETERSPTDFLQNLTASAGFLVPAIIGARTLYQ